MTPQAWSFEIATSRWEDGRYDGWQKRLSESEPKSEGVRNVSPLYALPAAPSVPMPDGQHRAGEVHMGMNVAGYVWEESLPDISAAPLHRVAWHWSTPPKSVPVERLFRESEVVDLLARVGVKPPKDARASALSGLTRETLSPGPPAELAQEDDLMGLADEPLISPFTRKPVDLQPVYDDGYDNPADQIRSASAHDQEAFECGQADARNQRPRNTAFRLADYDPDTHEPKA